MRRKILKKVTPPPIATFWGFWGLKQSRYWGGIRYALHYKVSAARVGAGKRPGRVSDVQRHVQHQHIVDEGQHRGATGLCWCPLSSSSIFPHQRHRLWIDLREVVLGLQLHLPAAVRVWVTPDNSTLDCTIIGTSYRYPVPLTLNGNVYVGSCNLWNTSVASSLFVFTNTGYLWSAPLPFYQTTTNHWGTAVYIRSIAFAGAGSYVCIINLANKTVTNVALLFRFVSPYFPVIAWAETRLAVSNYDTMYFFNGATGELELSIPTPCYYPLTIQSSNATNCLYYACGSLLTVYNWSTDAATAYKLFNSNIITSMVTMWLCLCGWQLLPWMVQHVRNNSVTMDYIINNLGWANITLMLQMTSYIYGINPWTTQFQWSITRDRVHQRTCRDDVLTRRAAGGRFSISILFLVNSTLSPETHRNMNISFRDTFWGCFFFVISWTQYHLNVLSERRGSGITYSFVICPT